jgi:hypothetical protein
MLYNRVVTILTFVMMLDPCAFAARAPKMVSSVATWCAKVPDLKQIDFGRDGDTASASYNPVEIRDLLPVAFDGT